MAARRRRESKAKQSQQVQESPARATGRHHLVLVPGFGGFDALGSLRYYHGVTEVLRGLGRPEELTVHYFPNLPTASVQIRARQLQHWLAALQERYAILEEDSIHLIGHSTGGLDLRQLLTDYRLQYERGAAGHWPPVLDQIASVQFLSTPHRGTGLARHLSRTWLRRTACRAAMFATYQVLRGLGEQGSGQLGRLGKLLMPSPQSPDWIDAALDTLVGVYTAHGSLERAQARSSYFTLLRWLLDMASDFNAITDLDPYKPPPGAPASPAHQDEEDFADDARFILSERRIRVRSIVTVARAPSPRLLPTALYTVTYGLTAYRPPERFTPCVVRELLDRRRERTLHPSDNDGFVNSISQVWPDARHSVLVEGDHADVIGHYRSPPAMRDGEAFSWHQYDLLGSQSDFNEKTFSLLWQGVGRFALESRGAQRRAPRPRRAAPAEPEAPAEPVTH